MSDGDGGAGAFGAAPCVGDVQPDELTVESEAVYELSPQECRDQLSSLLHSDSVELAPIHKESHQIHDGPGVGASIYPGNPGIPRFVRDEDAHPEGPRQTGGTAP
jgi:hypothetical protein